MKLRVNLFVKVLFQVLKKKGFITLKARTLAQDFSTISWAMKARQVPVYVPNTKHGLTRSKQSPFNRVLTGGLSETAFCHHQEPVCWRQAANRCDGFFK